MAQAVCDAEGWHRGQQEESFPIQTSTEAACAHARTGGGIGTGDILGTGGGIAEKTCPVLPK